jgi:hypothetical protein
MPPNEKPFAVKINNNNKLEYQTYTSRNFVISIDHLKLRRV